MNVLKDEHVRIDYLLAQGPEDNPDHRYFEVVQNYYNYRSVSSFLNDLVEIDLDNWIVVMLFIVLWLFCVLSFIDKIYGTI